MPEHIIAAISQRLDDHDQEGRTPIVIMLGKRETQELYEAIYPYLRSDGGVPPTYDEFFATQPGTIFDIPVQYVDAPTLLGVKSLPRNMHVVRSLPEEPR